MAKPVADRVLVPEFILYVCTWLGCFLVVGDKPAEEGFSPFFFLFGGVVFMGGGEGGGIIIINSFEYRQQR